MHRRRRWVRNGCTLPSVESFCPTPLTSPLGHLKLPIDKSRKIFSGRKCRDGKGYFVIQLSSSDLMIANSSIGSLCGAMRLNKIFRSRIKRLLASVLAIICRNVHTSEDELLDELVSAFEIGKKDFSGNLSGYFHLVTKLHGFPTLRKDSFHIREDVVSVSRYAERRFHFLRKLTNAKNSSLVCEVFDEYFDLLCPLVDQQLHEISKDDDLCQMPQVRLLLLRLYDYIIDSG